jgi:hypothetical protein
LEPPKTLRIGYVSNLNDFRSFDKMADEGQSTQDTVHEETETNPDASGATSGPQRRRYDPRDFSKPEELRGIIQSLEDQQKKQDAKLTNALDRIEQLLLSRNPTETSTVQPENREETHSIEPSDPTTPPRSTTGTPATPIFPRKKTELTEKISPLSDGENPTFKQWRASVQDRLEVNADHYPTKRSRKALVWGSTSGLAKEYLEPQYLSETEWFQDAFEMIELLATYFLSGNETETFRNAFHDLRQGVPDAKETFPQFKARFQSTAIQGNVARSEWFYYMWNKISPSLRSATAAVKLTWNGDYSTMVRHLTALDMERRRNLELNPLFGTKKTASTPTAARKPTVSGSATLPSLNSGARQATPFQRSGTPARQATPFRHTTPSTTKPQPTTTSSDSIKCYSCGKFGHVKANCPDNAQVQLLAREDDGDADGGDEGHAEEFPEDDSEEFREGNEEA